MALSSWKWIRSLRGGHSGQVTISTYPRLRLNASGCPVISILVFLLQRRLAAAWGGYVGAAGRLQGLEVVLAGLYAFQAA